MHGLPAVKLGRVNARKANLLQNAQDLGRRIGHLKLNLAASPRVMVARVPPWEMSQKCLLVCLRLLNISNQ